MSTFTDHTWSSNLSPESAWSFSCSPFAAVELCQCSWQVGCCWPEHIYLYLCCICNSFACQLFIFIYIFMSPACSCSLSTFSSSFSPACAPSPHFLSVLPRQSNRPSSCSICKQLKLFLSTLNKLFNFLISQWLTS